MRKGVKIAVISAVCTVTAVAILVGSLWYFGNKTDPVKVVPLMNHVMGYFEDSVQYDGRVTADNLQSVYSSSTQTVTQIFVSEGQTVKKGDPLLSYDTTLSDIQLERQRLNVQQAELNLQNAKKELTRINSMKPYSPPPPTQPPTEPSTAPLEPVDSLPYFMGGDGTEELPYRWLWSDGLTYDDAFIEKMLTENEKEIWVAFEVREQNALKGELLNRWGLHITVEYAETPAEEPSEAPPQEPSEAPAEETTQMPTEEPTQTPTEEPTAPDTVRTLRYAFFVPNDAPDSDDGKEEPTSPSTEWVDDSSGYTAAEIAQMRAEKQKEIRDLDVQYRMAKVDYERMKDEVENGIVYAKVDGTVTRLVDAETALTEGTPMLTVSGGGCYNVQVPIGEFELEAYPIGSEVTVMSWENYGMEIAGTIEAVSDTPTSSGYYFGGNPNVSRYMATVAVPADANLREGEYVGVTFRGGTADENAIYLENMYIRTEDGRSYVYKRGADGKLEKCEVRTGAVYWGYTAVYGDLTDEDYIAFPYGKEVKVGAETVEGEEDYGYFDYGVVY